MQAAELRIGNWVMGNAPYKVDINSIATHAIYEKNGEDYCKPIPLTEEWLLKFGFAKEESTSYKYYSNDNVRFCFEVMFTNNGFWVIIERMQSTDRTRMNMGHYNYVHQLQNLYFALTGTELTIKK